MDKKITFIGLGVMGYPMAGHWALKFCRDTCGQDIEVRVYNRTQSKAEAWLKEYRSECMSLNPRVVLSAPQSIPDAVKDSDVICTCLGGDPDLRMIYFDKGLLSSVKLGSLIIDHTTSSANIAREICQSTYPKGIGFLDAPISGGQVGAEKGILSIMVGGKEKNFIRGQKHMDAYGKSIVHIGKSGSGQTAKMVNQICISGLLQGLAEGLAFGKKAGLDMDKVLSVISKGAAGSWQMEQRGPTMLDGKYDFGFAVKWMIKDLNITLEEANRIGADCSFTAQIKKGYEKIRELGGDGYDTSSIMMLTDKK